MTPIPGSLVVSFLSPSDDATYADRQTVTIKVLVQAGGAPVAGATVAGTITTANGSITNISGTTGTDGTATFSYRINKRKTGTGLYTVAVTASRAGYTSSSATITFNVQ